MKIFDKRPLSQILCMLLGGFVFFSTSDSAFKIAVASIGVIILLFAIFVPLKEFKGRILTIICAVSILVGCLFSFLYFDLYFHIDKNYDGEADICGVVTDLEATTYGRKLAVETETINGSVLKRRKVVAFASLDECENVSVGSRIKIIGRIESFDDEYDDNTASYYRASGYSAVISDIKSIEYVEYAGVPIKNKISDYRGALCRRIIMYSDKESGGLLCTLLFGEREHLDGETKHDFERLGMSHVLALSGMHLAILSFAIESLLSKLGIMKKPRKIIQIIFVILYMAFTGFPSSVMRAGIMLIITSLLFLLSHRADSITTLFIAVTVILITEPYAVFDIGLWLSAFATLGILLFSELYEAMYSKRKPTVKSRLFNTLVIPVVISLFAFSATFLLSATTFDSFSLLAPITTPIYSIAIEIYMYLGILFLICGKFLSLGTIVKPFGGFIIKTVRGLSSINGIYVSAEYAIISIMLIAFTVFLCAFAVLNIKRKRSAVTLLGCMLAVIFVTAFSYSLYSANKDHFEYTLNASGEWITMQDGDSNTVIDVTEPSTKGVSLEITRLNDLGLNELDRYIFTSYSSYAHNAVDILLGSMLIGRIYLPVPQNEYEFSIAEGIVSEHSTSKSEIIFYEADEFIECGNFNVFTAYRSSDKSKLALTILYQDKFYTYISSGMLENDTKNVALSLIDGCNTLILGRHGNSYLNYKFIYRVNNLDQLVISSKNLELPSETVRYYNEQGTDLHYSPERLELHVE